MSQHVQTARNVVALQKTGEVFMFFYHDDDIEALIWTFARFAANPQLNFSWTDAATLIREIIALDSPVSIKH